MIRPARTIEEKAVLVGYLANKLSITPQALVGQMPFEAAAIIRNGRAVGAVLYTNYRQYSIEMTAAGEPGWLTRADIRNAFFYPFIDLGCWTVLTMINRSNTPSRELNRRLGFTELCVVETGAGKAGDVIMYGMSRNKCAWLPQELLRSAA